jgi:hypothetical protein
MMWIGYTCNVPKEHHVGMCATVLVQCELHGSKQQMVNKDQYVFVNIARMTHFASPKTV